MPMLIAGETTILSPFQRAFRSGCFSSASAVSLTTMSVKAIEGRSPVPATALNCCRRLTRLVASTVVESVTPAAVCALWTMRSAIVRRMGVTAISRYPGMNGILPGWKYGRRSSVRGRGADVALDDPAVTATSFQSDRIDAQLARDAPGARRDARLHRGRARLRPSRGCLPARTEPRPPGIVRRD